MEPIAIELEPKLRRRLEALGQAKSRSPGWLMKEAIRQYLDHEEAAEVARRESLERWDRYEATGAYVSHEEVTRWLQTWGTAKERPCPKPKRR